VAIFKYKFKAIKEIKQRIEKKTQKDLAVIDIDIANKSNEIMDLTKVLKEQKRKKIGQQSKQISELHFYEKYESYLIEQIGFIQKYIAEKRIERNKKIELLEKQAKETKIFEKMEEKSLVEFIKTQDKLEQKEIDEFAINEFLKE